MRIHDCVTLLSEKTTFGYFALKNFKKLSVSVWNYIIPTIILLIILPILDYCGAVFHGCGKGNEEGLECLQRRAGRIVLNTAHSSTEQMVKSLGWDTLARRGENHIVKLVEKCLKETAPNYFQLKRHDIHHYDIRNKNKLVIDRDKLESTKRAFFIKGQIFFIIVCEL